MNNFHNWSLVLHIYQPPNQRADILKLVSQEGYAGLLDLLLETKYPVTLNVSGILLEQLVNQQPDVLAKIKKLTGHKNITFTNTAVTHALLPLWPLTEVSWQLKHNRKVVKEILGSTVKLSGLYLPECAYASTLDSIIKQDRADFVVIDELSLRSSKYHPLAKEGPSGPKFVVRNRALSQALATSVEQTGELLDGATSNLVAVLDGEVFGHFDPHALERLRTIFNQFGQRLISTGQLARQKASHVPVRSASWETEPRDIWWRNYFPLWDSKKNTTHQAMWHFLNSVMRALHKTGSLLQNGWERKHFSNAMASCWWWWANPHRTAGPFKMKVWNPDLIVEGMTEAIKAIRTDPSIPPRTKWRLETEYADLLKHIWRTHWKMRS